MHFVRFHAAGAGWQIRGRGVFEPDGQVGDTGRDFAIAKNEIDFTLADATDDLERLGHYRFRSVAEFDSQDRPFVAQDIFQPVERHLKTAETVFFCDDFHRFEQFEAFDDALRQQIRWRPRWRIAGIVQPEDFDQDERKFQSDDGADNPVAQARFFGRTIDFGRSVAFDRSLRQSRSRQWGIAALASG